MTKLSALKNCHEVKKFPHHFFEVENLPHLKYSLHIPIVSREGRLSHILPLGLSFMKC